mmetsp:Transcript_46360/g.39082  ORF Transcript_46360/g.39082 Transcript_46360/m.39082 type:complete len:124 (+) Transcript_46360:606-977(+)
MLIEKENEVQSYLRHVNHDNFKQKKKDLSKNMVMGLLTNKPPRNGSTDFKQRKLIISDDVNNLNGKFELSFILDSMMIFEDKIRTHESSLGQLLDKYSQDSNWYEFSTLVNAKIEILRSYLSK